MTGEPGDGGAKAGGAGRRWLVVGGCALAAILAPFALLGEAIDGWTRAFLLTTAGHPTLTAAVLGGLLAADIVLPVPSSVVSTSCGWFLGFGLGMAVSAAGMTVSCAAGFAIGRVLGARVVGRFVGASEMERVGRLNRRYGDWLIVLARPVPVLAEASVLLAGLGAVSWRRFLLLSTLSNLGVSAVYGFVGSALPGQSGFLPALAASILLPWLVMGAANRHGMGRCAPGTVAGEAVSE